MLEKIDKTLKVTNEMDTILVRRTLLVVIRKSKQANFTRVLLSFAERLRDGFPASRRNRRQTFPTEIVGDDF